MRIFQSFRMAFATLLAKKVRSFLTMLGTIIGVAAVIAIVSVMQSQNEANRDLWLKMSENLVTAYYRMYNASLTESENVNAQFMDFINYDIRDLTTGVSPNSSNYMTVAYEENSMTDMQVRFVSEQFTQIEPYTVKEGRDLCFMDIQENTNVCLIGSYTKEYLFGYEDAVGKIIMIGDTRFEVAGVFDQRTTDEEMESEWYDPRWSYDNIVAVPYNQIKYIVRNNWNQTITDFYVKCKDAEATKEATKLITEFFADIIGPVDDYGWSENGYYHVNSSTYAEEIKEAEKTQTFTMMIIAFISLLVGGIGIMNIMLVTVTERTREIGIRKAIGAPKRSIVTQFLIEACVMSGLGGFVGVFLGFAVTLFWGKIQYNIIATPDLFITLLAFFVSVAMGVAFGIYPAAKAANLQPVDALRNE